MAQGLTASELAAYEADGMLFLGRLLDEALVERLRDSIEALETRERREGVPEGFFDRTRLWERDAGFRAICFDSPAARIAARLLGVDVLKLLYDQVFIKAPATGIRTPWHNDLPNWPVRGTQLISIWVALDAIGPDNGILEFVRGSHRWGRWSPPVYADIDGRITHFHVGDPKRESQESLAAEFADFEAELDRHEILRWATEPGEALAFHALTVHGARGNAHPKRRRRAYSMRFAGPDVRYHEASVSNESIKNASLRTGDPLTGEQYPVVYRA